jgi:hypothetical protein
VTAPAGGPRIGRILTGEERAARMASETNPVVPGEMLRSSFVISARHVLTAWHCVRDVGPGESLLWFRLRATAAQGRSYVYVPVRLSNYDEAFDVAALAVDASRLAEAQLGAAQAAELMIQLAVPLAVEVSDGDTVQVMGFPQSASSADSDTNSATVVDTRLPLGDVTGLKLSVPALGAVSPVDHHGLSGGPVLKTWRTGGERLTAAVGIIRAAPSGAQPGTAAGGGLIATRVEDVLTLPEVQVAVAAARAATGRRPPRVHRDDNALAASGACLRKLRDSLVEVRDPELGLLVGWPHFFDEPAEHRRPTAIGTAYGLKLALVLNGQDNRPDRSRLAETLWKLRRPDGGWAARTGTGAGRPEVSALVLGALSSSGFDAGHLAEAGSVLEEEVTPGLDPAAIERTYVVGAVIRGLLRSLPTSPRLAELRDVLVSGAAEDPAHENLACWSARLASRKGDAPHPSAAHTAQAVVALVRAQQVLGAERRAQDVVEQAVRWLRARQDLANQTEQIRRFVRDGQPWETLTVRHFTAAWAARALLLVPAAERSGADPLLDAAVRQVWAARRDGFWEWDDGERPLWMSYQGACVLRDYAMRTSTPLP